MANTGLKPYTKQFEENIDNGAKIYVNLYSNDANTIVELPIFTTFGERQLELKLYFNYQDRNVLGFFGKGARLNIFKSISLNNNTMTVTNSDGSMDDYTCYEVWNYETNCKMRRIQDGLLHYDLQDRKGNTYVFDSANAKFPSKIKKKNTTIYTLNSYSGVVTSISNGMGDEIAFIYNSSHIVTSITFRHYGSIRLKADLIYTNNTISKITTKRVNGSSEYIISETNLNITSSKISLYNGITTSKVEGILSNNKVTSLKKYLNNAHIYTTTISYESNKTLVTDYLGNHHKIEFYDGKPIYEYDTLGKVLVREYDENNHVETETPFLDLNHLEESIISPDFTLYDRNNINLGSNTPEEPFSNLSSYSVASSGSNPHLSKKISHHGLGTDIISFLLYLKSYDDVINDSFILIILSIYDNGEVVNEESFTIRKENLIGYYRPIRLMLKAMYSYEEIELQIYLTGIGRYIFTGLNIGMVDYGTSYSMDDIGNIDHISTIYQDIEMEYYQDTNIKSIRDNASYYQQTYDYDGNMTSCIDQYGAKALMTYNNNHLMTKRIINKEENKILNEEYTYSTGMVASYKDELSNITTYAYDTYGRLYRITNPNDDKVTYSYDNYYNISSVKYSNTEDDITYSLSYNTNNQMGSTTLPNGSNYSFSYYNNGKLKEVKTNNISILSLSYNQKFFIENIKYGEGSDGYSFTYNSDNNLEKIYYVFPNNTRELEFQYEYNSKKEFIKVLDENNNILKEISYDSFGNVCKIQKSSGKIEYVYDDLVHITNTKKEISNNKIYESFNSRIRSRKRNVEAILPYIQKNNFYGATIFNNTTDLVGLDFVISSSTIDGISYAFDKVPCVLLENGLDYGINSTSSSISFWFKPNNEEGKYILSLGNDVINIKIVNSYVNIYDGNTLMHTSKYEIRNEEWNFFSFSFNCSVSLYQLVLNEKLERFGYNGNIITRLQENSISHIASNYQGNYGISKITCLSIGHETAVPYYCLHAYYLSTKEYIIENLLDDIYGTVEISDTNLHTINQIFINQAEIYPLENNVNSLKGKKPTRFNIRDYASYDKDRSFNYNKELKHYAYIADGAELVYSLDIYSYGTIYMNAYIDGRNEKQYFFQIGDFTETILGLYRDESNLFIEVNDQIIETNIFFSDRTIHSIGLSYNIFNSYITIRLYLDGQIYGYTRNVSLTPSSLSIMVGRRFLDDVCPNIFLGDLIENYPLYGQISNLTILNMYLDDTSECLNLFDSLSSALVDYTKTTHFNNLGMVFKKEIHKSNQTILNHIYSYKQNPELENHISKTIYAENISYGNHSTTIGYNTDSLGRITLISSSLFNNGHSYSYDYKGYLIGEDNISYTYDDNGNILSCGNDTFTYDSVIKDRLMKVNNQIIEYSLDKPLYPINYDGWNYTYKGKRLKEVTKNNNKTITYLYDDLGFITKKTIQESNNTYIIDYFYDDNKLVTEIKDDIRNDYIYDEYDELYGFIQNNTYIYYYVRDYIGNILGIVDNSGNLKVKYDYDAYGNIISITGESIYNPFRYKGYYYDNDIEMYYCHNRFYNPKWRRWLTPDSPNYLNIDTPSGMNLFIYCNNNPVMYSDGEGNIAISLLVGLAVSFGVGFAASTINQGIQYGWANINFLQSGIDGLFALGSTALAYTGIGLIGSMAAGGLIGAGQYGLDSGVFHDDFSWSGLMIATGLGIISGAISGRGAQNATAIANNNLNQEARNGIKALMTSATRYGINSSAYRSTFNLWGKTVSTAIHGAISKNFTSSAVKIWLSTAGLSFVGTGLGKLSNVLGFSF